MRKTRDKGLKKKKKQIKRKGKTGDKAKKKRKKNINDFSSEIESDRFLGAFAPNGMDFAKRNA